LISVRRSVDLNHQPFFLSFDKENGFFIHPKQERQMPSNFTREKFHLILHLKFHLTSNKGAVTGQCIALGEQSKKQLEPL
jgi:hypothetical protein